MAEQNTAPENQGFQSSDISTRVRDLDEKSRLIRERVLLLGKNLIELKEESQEKIAKLSLELEKISSEIELLKKISKDLVDQLSRFVKREEMMLIERMLKDFQPLEFMRRKDVERLIDEKMRSRK